MSEWDGRSEICAKVPPLYPLEDGPQHEAAERMYRNMRHVYKKNGVVLSGGVQTRWLFHGCPESAIDSIVNNPLESFSQVMSGDRVGDIYGALVFTLLRTRVTQLFLGLKASRPTHLR